MQDLTEPNFVGLVGGYEELWEKGEEKKEEGGGGGLGPSLLGAFYKMAIKKM